MPATLFPSEKLTFPIQLHEDTHAGNDSFVLFQNSEKDAVYEILELFVKLTTDATVANRQLQIAKYMVYQGISTELVYNYIAAAVAASSYGNYHFAPEGSYQSGGATQSLHIGIGHRFLYFKDYIYLTVTAGVVGDNIEWSLRLRKHKCR